MISERGDSYTQGHIPLGSIQDSTEVLWGPVLVSGCSSVVLSV